MAYWLMTLSALTDPGAVVAAIREFDRLSRTEFLSRYGFKSAKAYVLLYEGAAYDSKAIAGVAYGKQHPDAGPLAASSFSGGEATVARRLTDLGFTVERRANPDWTRDELILVCDVMSRRSWQWLDDDDPDVLELSGIVRRMPLHPESQRLPSFRNPNGVSRKTADIATVHPDYRGKTTRGSKLDRVVLRDCLADPAGMAHLAEEIRRLLKAGRLPPTPEPDEIDIEVPEGRLMYRMHCVRERNGRLKRARMAFVRRRDGVLGCEVCGFDFAVTYGSRGSGFIEAHHVLPLHAAGTRRNSVEDLVLVCANCHRMIHRGRVWLTPIQLAGLLAEARSTA